MDSYRYGAPRQVRFGPGPLTPGVKYILIACVSIHVALLLLYKNDPSAVEKIQDWLGLAPYYFWRGRVWQVFTYLFFHRIDSTDYIWHLALNMLFLWMFGVTLERDWGTRSFLKFMAVVGVGSGLVSALILYGSDVPIIGLSGALFGIFAAWWVLYPDREVIFFVFPMRVRTMVYIVLAFEVFRALAPGASDSVAHLTHFAGLGIGYLYLRPYFYRRLRERYYRWKLRRIRKKRGFTVIPKDDDDEQPPTLH